MQKYTLFGQFGLRSYEADFLFCASKFDREVKSIQWLLSFFSLFETHSAQLEFTSKVNMFISKENLFTFSLKFRHREGH